MVSISSLPPLPTTVEEFERQKSELLQQKAEMRFSWDIVLSEREVEVDKVLSKLKSDLSREHKVAVDFDFTQRVHQLK